MGCRRRLRSRAKTYQKIACLPTRQHMTYHFPKAERLHRKKVINTLFRTGKRWYGKFLILYYLPLKAAGNPNHQVLFSVPKSRYKKAVDRNKVKRRLKEAYRQHKHLLPGKKGDPNFILGYVCKGKEATPLSYDLLLQDITVSIAFLRDKYEKGLVAS